MSETVSGAVLVNASTSVAIHSPGDRPSLRTAADEAGMLSGAFGVEFTMVDGDSAEVLHAAADLPGRDWGDLAELCREVARRGKPELVQEAGPLVTLAVPLAMGDDSSLVGLGSFLLRMPASEAELQCVAETLGSDRHAALRWCECQTPMAAETLERIARLVLSNADAERRASRLEGEIEHLAMQIGATYEEISLIYRLIQNLKISRKPIDLGQLAVEWLVAAMPFDGMAIYLLPEPSSDPSKPDLADEPAILTHGNCPLERGDFERLLAELGIRAANRPMVMNRPVTNERLWQFPWIGELIVVPIGEADHVFGWLAAFNHTGGEEFGTVEADLLCSVSAILGIHASNSDLYRQQAELLSGIVRALTSAIDAKDPYTCGHSDRVARVAVRLAQELGCTPETVETIYLSGLLHDIGKIGIDDQVLRKPGRLTAEEFEHIKMHAQIGYNILLDLKQLGEVLPVVLHHHESWDGSGYPHGLAGGSIPELARIVAVADAFDAMGSDRPYRQGMPEDRLDAIIREGAGKQWDPEVVGAFFRAREDIRSIARREPEDEPPGA